MGFAQTRERVLDSTAVAGQVAQELQAAEQRGTSAQAALADAIFQVTGKRFRDLPLRQHDLRWS